VYVISTAAAAAAAAAGAAGAAGASAAAAAAAAAGASKFYGEAMKQGTAESLLSLAGSSSDAEATVAMASLLGNIDEKVRLQRCIRSPRACTRHACCMDLEQSIFLTASAAVLNSASKILAFLLCELRHTCCLLQLADVSCLLPLAERRHCHHQRVRHHHDGQQRKRAGQQQQHGLRVTYVLNSSTS
jgi:hypothetical protein